MVSPVTHPLAEAAARAFEEMVGGRMTGIEQGVSQSQLAGKATGGHEAVEAAIQAAGKAFKDLGIKL
jgi:hypothetical protein